MFNSYPSGEAQALKYMGMEFDIEAEVEDIFREKSAGIWWYLKW